MGGPHDESVFPTKIKPHFQAYETTQKSKPRPKLRLVLFKKLRCWYVVENTCCVCVRGCRIASMWFNYKDERRLALGTTWCKVTLYFGGRASFCIGFFAYDTCMFMVIRLLWTYLCIFSAVLARLCKFYGVATRCIYSSECDGCACRECHIHCPTRWCESCHWQWYLLERIEVGRALSERSWFAPRLKKSLDYNVRPAPPAIESLEGTSHSPLECWRYLPHPAPIVVSL